MSMTQIQHDKWALFHPDGDWYTFITHSDNTVHILHNGKNAQEVIDGMHHSDGCYTVSVGRSLWHSLVSWGFETNK